MLLRVLILAAGLATCTAPGSAQGGAFVGVVLDSSDSPLKGATVLASGRITGARAETFTDEDGSYSLGGLPQGVYDVSMSSAGHETRNIAMRSFGPGTVIAVNARLTRSVSGVGMQIAAVVDAASYNRRLPSGAGFAVAFVETGLEQEILFNDTLDSEVGGYSIQLRGKNGESAEAHPYFLTPSQFAFRYQLDSPEPPSPTEAWMWNVRICRNDVCGPSYEVQIEQVPGPSPFFVNSAGFGDAIATNPNGNVNGFGSPVQGRNPVFTAWLNGRGSPNDNTSFYLGGRPLGRLYYGVTNGIDGFLQANLSLADSFTPPGRYPFWGCDLGADDRRRCSGVGSLYVGDPNGYVDPLGWGAAIRDIYSPGGILGAEVVITEANETIQTPAGDTASAQSVILIDPSVVRATAATYHWQAPLGEWNVTTRRETNEPPDVFQGSVSWLIIGYGQDLRSFPDGAASFFYSQPTDRQIDRPIRVDWTGSVEGEPFQFVFSGEVPRNTGASAALALIANHRMGPDVQVRELMEILKNVSATSSTGPPVILQLRERIDAGDLCYAEATINLTPGQLQNEDTIRERLVTYEQGVKPLLDSCSYPHMRSVAIGVQHGSVRLVTPPAGAPVRHARQVRREHTVFWAPRGIPLE